jgi:predicted transcriptional regulator
MIAAGKKQSEIAQALGVSTRQVKRYRADQVVQDRIAELVERHRDKIDRLFDTMLLKIEEGFEANDVFMGEETGAPDHRARQTAIRNMIQLSSTLRPRVDKKTRRGLTYSEMVEMYQDFVERAKAGDDPLADENLASRSVQ